MKRQDRDIEYQSVILERENKDLKGRLRISGNTIIFQKKVGLISKKFEIEFQTTMKSIKNRIVSRNIKKFTFRKVKEKLQ